MNRSDELIIADRARLLGPNVPTFYDDPIHLIREMGSGFGMLTVVNI